MNLECVMLFVSLLKIVKSFKSPTFWASRLNPEVTRKSRNTFENPEFWDSNSFGSISGYKISSRNVLVWDSVRSFGLGSLPEPPLYIIYF